MKTRHRLPVAGRNPERGAIAFAIAAMWMVLFGLAAFAVDLGYRYQAKFGLQAAADAAVRAGMPSFVSGNTMTATNAAIAMAGANGYPSGQVTVTPSGNLFQVDISSTPPTFFLGLFGSPSAFPLGATSVGEKTSTPLPVILALGGCASQGLKISSNATSTFNGDVESDGPLAFDNGPSSTTVNGSVLNLSSCGTPTMFGAPAPPIGTNVVTGTVGTAGLPFPNPFAAVNSLSFTCTGGTSLLTPGNPPVIPLGGPGGTSDLIPPGVYCSSTDMVVSDAGTTQIYAPNVTFVSLGKITIGANGGATLSANATAPSQIVVYSEDATSCSVGQSVQVGFNFFNINGSIYAPNGCIRAGGKVLNVTGAIVGKEIALSPDPWPPGWTVGTGGGGGPGTWRMHR